MALKYSLTHRTNAMGQLNTDIGNSAILKLVSGTRPGSVANALIGNVISTHNCNSVTFGSAINGVLTANQIANAVASNSGTVTHFRISKFDGTGVVDGDVSTTGSDLNLDNVNINAGQTIALSNATITAFGF